MSVEAPTKEEEVVVVETSQDLTSLEEISKGPWTKEEDELLKRLVLENDVAKTTKWSLIATHMKNRNSKQCRERWLNHLNPHIRKGEWTAAEEEIFLDAHTRLGNAWSEIAKLLPGAFLDPISLAPRICAAVMPAECAHGIPRRAGRSDNSIKNHWNSALRRMGPASSVRRTQGDDQVNEPELERKRRASEALEKYAKEYTAARGGKIRSSKSKEKADAKEADEKEAVGTDASVAPARAGLRSSCAYTPTAVSAARITPGAFCLSVGGLLAGGLILQS
jgi:hypothetical protein